MSIITIQIITDKNVSSLAGIETNIHVWNLKTGILKTGCGVNDTNFYVTKSHFIASRFCNHVENSVESIKT